MPRRENSWSYFQAVWKMFNWLQLMNRNSIWTKGRLVSEGKAYLVPQGTFLTSSVCSVVWGGKNISILRTHIVKELPVPEEKPLEKYWEVNIGELHYNFSHQRLAIKAISFCIPADMKVLRQNILQLMFESGCTRKVSMFNLSESLICLELAWDYKLPGLPTRILLWGLVLWTLIPLLILLLMTKVKR